MQSRTSEGVKISGITMSPKAGAGDDNTGQPPEGGEPVATVDNGHSPPKKPAKYIAKFDQRVTAKYDIKVCYCANDIHDSLWSQKCCLAYYLVCCNAGQSISYSIN